MKVELRGAAGGGPPGSLPLQNHNTQTHRHTHEDLTALTGNNLDNGKPPLFFLAEHGEEDDEDGCCRHRHCAPALLLLLRLCGYCTITLIYII